MAPPFLTVCPCESQLTSLCLSFFIFQAVILNVPHRGAVKMTPKVLYPGLSLPAIRSSGEPPGPFPTWAGSVPFSRQRGLCQSFGRISVCLTYLRFPEAVPDQDSSLRRLLGRRSQEAGEYASRGGPTEGKEPTGEEAGESSPSKLIWEMT